VAGTPLAGGFVGQSYTVFAANAAPFVQSIQRANPAGPVASATEVTYTVTFSEPVTGVDQTDFQLVKTGTLATELTDVTPVNDATYSVTISGIAGHGNLWLNLVDDGTIRDLAGSP